MFFHFISDGCQENDIKMILASFLKYFLSFACYYILYKLAIRLSIFTHMHKYKNYQMVWFSYVYVISTKKLLISIRFPMRAGWVVSAMPLDILWTCPVCALATTMTTTAMPTMGQETGIANMVFVMRKKLVVV